MSARLLGPVTDADLRRWQRQRLDLLVELVKFGEDRKLTPLSWTLSVHSLVGQATGHANEEKHAAFEAWTTALELARWGEHHHNTGRIHLHAAARDLWGRGVGVTVVADVWDVDPAD